MAQPLIGNPQDILTTPYGYSGQMAPETAVAEQSLNRRRLLANMLTQRGLQQRQGQMVGRFYVPPSAAEQFGDLASVLGGALGGRAIESQQNDLMKADRQMVIDAIREYQAGKNRPDMTAAAGAAAPPQPTPPLPTQPTEQPGQAVTPPYNGEVGAAPMPEVGVQPDPSVPFRGIAPAPPDVPDQHTGVSNFQAPGSVDAGQRNMRGIDMGAAQPADMSQFAPPPATDAQPLPQPAPAPTVPPPVQEPAPRKTTIDDLTNLLTHQHPQVRAYGQMLAQQMQREQEHGAQRDFLREEKALDRDVRREGITENSRMREAQMQNTMALTQMQIDSRLQQGRDANDLKATLAQQSQELAKLQMQNTKELKQAEIGSRESIAKQHDQTLKAIGEMKRQSRGQLPTSALKMQNEELDAIGTASSLKSDMASIRSQIESGKLQLGLASNLMGTAKNKLGMSDENSRNLASFKASLEKMRNESLRLNKGVQTEGDSVRAWNELIENINDPQLVMQRLSEVEAMNDRAVNLRRMNVDTIRQNFGVDPMETSGYTSQPAAVGANRASSGGTRSVKRTGMHQGKKVIEYSDGSIEYAN